MVPSRDPDPHEFPAPHKDSVESFLECSVPTDKVSQIVEFDGRVVVNRTRGELSTRCHDEEANNLALNLTNDIMAGGKTVQEAREYYAQEFLAARKKDPTPYMGGLKFEPSGGADRDKRMLSDEQLEKAVGEGKAKGQ